MVRAAHQSRQVHSDASIYSISRDPSWSATVGLTPHSPEWNPGATISLPVVRGDKS